MEDFCRTPTRYNGEIKLGWSTNAKIEGNKQTKLSTCNEQINSLSSTTNSALLENWNPNNKKEDDKF